MATRKQSKAREGALTLVVRTADDTKAAVDADRFFTAARKWLESLKAFAAEQGEPVQWRIVGLKKSSAIVQVEPINPITGASVPLIAERWDSGVKAIEAEFPAPPFGPQALKAFADFASEAGDNTIIAVGREGDEYPISAAIQKIVQDMVMALPNEEYEHRGSVRGRLAVLNSWNPKDRWFRLQIPLAPDKPVKCIYGDQNLVRALGEGFEGMVEVIGNLRYRMHEAWPFEAEVDHIRVLSELPRRRLEDLIGALKLSNDSVSTVRILRDAE